MVLKRLKLRQVFDGAVRTFSDTQVWASEGGRNLKISAKKAIFLVSSAIKTKLQQFWPPLEKRWEKSTGVPLAIILPMPTHTSM